MDKHDINNTLTQAHAALAKHKREYSLRASQEAWKARNCLEEPLQFDTFPDEESEEMFYHAMHQEARHDLNSDIRLAESLGTPLTNEDQRSLTEFYMGRVKHYPSLSVDLSGQPGHPCGEEIIVMDEGVSGADMGPETTEEPNYYDVGGIPAIDFIKAKLTPAQFAGFCLGNVIKYLARANYKDNGSKDLEKALDYLTWTVAAEQVEEARDD